ncbi:hypothetical protein ECG_07534 [Echinococcus granulosus]|uniref:DUF5738 domain-containing protein n=1 Tax=Echinococcus granulosus TaxID=6210 RepID=U6JRE4_ECHGR|nr:hypothetical protein EGR_07700 [Echinococcus granulosus]EUB57458.1 hypothetical protein EGR_07700 [Echinococcus granulosus]KAH9279448.1 hypothetical protein ECG_07534 [Echinococcus granulosus]CDS24491.1 hypothetical protein EgrG_000389200 [Echinococcus granulosus]
MSNLFHRLRNLSYDKIGLPRSTGQDRDDAITSPPAATTAFVGGSRLTRGRTLASEIDWYKHRVEALVHFLDRMAPQWWDHMYPFGESGKLVRRPSRTADNLRATHNRLVARLTRLTPRVIVSSTNAVMSIEEAEVVPILPPSLMRGRSATRAVEAHVIGMEKQLAIVFTFVRRLSEIERLKQQMILYTMDWIKADSNDQQMRAQRRGRLVQHVQPCLIENHEGVAALIRHYFRRRSYPKNDEKIKQILDSSDDAKMQLKYAFSGITADSICSTNRLIMELIKTSHLEGISGEAFDGETAKMTNRSSQQPLFENLIGPSIKEVYEWTKRYKSDDADPTSISTEWLKFGKAALFGETFGPKSIKYDLYDVSEEEKEEEDDLVGIRRRVLSDLSRHEGKATSTGVVGDRGQHHLHKSISMNVRLSGDENSNTAEGYRLSKYRSGKTL